LSLFSARRSSGGRAGRSMQTETQTEQRAASAAARTAQWRVVRVSRVASALFVALMLRAPPWDDQFIALSESPPDDRRRGRCAAAAATAGLTGSCGGGADCLWSSTYNRLFVSILDCIGLVPRGAGCTRHHRPQSARGSFAAREAPTRQSGSESASDDEDPSTAACERKSERG